jgi:hypothetical protein
MPPIKNNLIVLDFRSFSKWNEQPVLTYKYGFWRVFVEPKLMKQVLIKSSMIFTECSRLDNQKLLTC